jgi:pantoate--beta-alanine ligase
MQLIEQIAGLVALDDLRAQDRPLVLVPTMGALHEGHLSLVRQGAELGPVVVSIFVNPTQFGPGEDFESYPRDLQSDLDLLEPLGVDAVFAPQVHEVYGREDGVRVQPGHRARGLCGEDRPGHFAGVLTVVAKLFGLVRPDLAIFGRKDAQQCLVIGQMVDELHLPVRLIDGVTVREPDGLAMSSRNRYLGTEDRQRALCLSGALKEAEALIMAGERSAEALEKAMLENLGPSDRPEYAQVRQVPDLEKPDQISGMTLLAVAARVGPARLIDNLVLDIRPEGVRPGQLLGSATG